MTMMIQDRDVARKFIQQRRESGNDRWDEVWDGVYIVMPNPNVEHQDIASGFVAVFRVVLDWTGSGKSYAGLNVSDQLHDWTRNYRCPDVAVYLSGNSAMRMAAYMRGGPDFAVEIVSPDDRSREKFDFYAKVGVRELLIVDRDPWTLELYRRSGAEWSAAVTSTQGQPSSLRSEILPLAFRLEPGEAKPAIIIEHTDGVQRWTV